MKKHVISFVFIFLALMTIVTGCSDSSTENSQALSINNIQYDPLSFTGEITITGVNAGFYQRNPSIFFVVDTAELIACKNLNCGAFQLPVIYNGDTPLPELADEVNIIGSWIEYEEDGQTITIFGITEFEVKRNIMSLLT